MTTTKPERRYASVDHAALYADLGRSSIRRLIHSGQLTAYRIGERGLRVDLAELDALLTPIGGGNDGAS